VVDVRAVRALPRPVTLAQVKADPRLAHLGLVRQPRLSVVPVDEQAWRLLLSLAGEGRGPGGRLPGPAGAGQTS
jgi:predicted RNA-binding protein with PUA-like domain